MTARSDVGSVDHEFAPAAAPRRPDGRRSRRRLTKALICLGLILLLGVAGTGLWFFLGREGARQLSDDEAVANFRAGGGASADPGNRPAAGVYPATASGRESIGVPGFDERLGPNAPVTVTHGDGGCYTYRADFSSHHWRSWTFCPTATATFSLTGLESWTERAAPGLNIATRSSYRCQQPLDFLWPEAVVGEQRAGACTGTSDLDGSITEDAAGIEVLESGTLVVGGRSVPVVRVRTTDTFSRAQTGSEVNQWWLEASTGLPVKVVVDAELKGGASDYSESAVLELSALTPAT